MYKEHEVFKDPKDASVKLWRYLDFIKYYSLLERSELFFCSANVLKRFDPFEGTYPRLEYEHLMRDMKPEGYSHMCRILSESTFASCWHYSDNESVAMWKLYSSYGDGLAIQTSISSFKACFDESPDNVYIGTVQYVDYEKDTFYEHSDEKYYRMNSFVPFIHKRIIFEYEREYRAIYSGGSESDEVRDGKFIKIDLDTLIDKIYVAPFTPGWIFKLVQRTLTKFLPNKVVERSIFEKTPYN